MTESVASQVSNSASRKLAHDTDNIIRKAVNVVLGDGWTLLSVKDRLRSERFKGAAFETIFLDNEPILELHDPTFEQQHTETGYVMNVHRQYRILAKEGGEMIWETAIASIALVTCVALYCQNQLERDRQAREANKRTSDALETTAEMLRDTARTWANRAAQEHAMRRTFPDFGGIDPNLGAGAYAGPPLPDNTIPFGKKKPTDGGDAA